MTDKVDHFRFSLQGIKIESVPFVRFDNNRHAAADFISNKMLRVFSVDEIRALRPQNEKKFFLVLMELNAVDSGAHLREIRVKKPLILCAVRVDHHRGKPARPYTDRHIFGLNMFHLNIFFTRKIAFLVSFCFGA